MKSKEIFEGFITCSALLVFSHPLPLITILIDPSLILLQEFPLDLVAATLALFDVAERSSSAFQKKFSGFLLTFLNLKLKQNCINMIKEIQMSLILK